MNAMRFAIERLLRTVGQDVLAEFAGCSSDITGLYTARYGVPPVAKKVYIQVNQFVDGWESRPVSFWAIVPATA
jgi:hypothetical protein